MIGKPRGRWNGALLVHQGELGIEAIVCFVAADVPPGPGIKNHRLPHFDPPDRRTRIHHQAQSIASRNMQRGAVASSENRNGKPQCCEVRIEIGTGGQNRNQDSLRVCPEQAWNRYLLETDDILRRTIIIPA